MTILRSILGVVILIFVACSERAAPSSDILLEGSDHYSEVPWKLSISDGLLAIPSDSIIEIFESLSLNNPKYFVTIPDGVWLRYKELVQVDSGGKIIAPNEHTSEFVNRMPSKNINSCTILNDSLIAYSLTLNYVIINHEGTGIFGPKMLVIVNFRTGDVLSEYPAEFEGDEGFFIHPHNLPVSWNPLLSDANFYQMKYYYDSTDKSNKPSRFVRRLEFGDNRTELKSAFIENSEMRILSMHKNDLFAINDSLASHFTIAPNWRHQKDITYSGADQIVDVVFFKDEYYLLGLKYGSEGVNVRIIKHSTGDTVFEKNCDVASVKLHNLKNDLILVYDLDAQTHIFKFH